MILYKRQKLLLDLVHAAIDIAAALIDRETTLKTLVVNNVTVFLRAENPAYPDLLPAEELDIQGIAKGVIRNIAA